MAVQFVGGQATLTISNGQQETTNGVATGAWTRFGLVAPSAWTTGGTTALQVLVSVDDSTYQPIINSLGESASQYVYCNAGYSILALPDGLDLWPYFKLKASAAQGAQRDLIIVAGK